MEEGRALWRSSEIISTNETRMDKHVLTQCKKLPENIKEMILSADGVTAKWGKAVNNFPSELEPDVEKDLYLIITSVLRKNQRSKSVDKRSATSKITTPACKERKSTKKFGGQISSFVDSISDKQNASYYAAYILCLYI